MAAVMEVAMDDKGLSVDGHDWILDLGESGEGIGFVVNVDSSKARHLKSFL